EEVLEGLGYAKEMIKELRDAKVI
ncbi:MAG: hypothetical protein HW373_1154, partial [Deltaproteobacteria bacterium]|nr:hypothetical protein [Deltaproteobacteria bacterium]